MRARISIQGLVLSLVVAGLCAAQGNPDKSASVARPNFTGKWLLDTTKDQSGRSYKSSILIGIVVRQSEPEIKITRVRNLNGKEVIQESVYYTDGRGETNQGPMISEVPGPNNRYDEVKKSRTRWKGNKLVTQTSVRKLLAGHVLDFEMTEEWKLSPDGQTLTETSTTRLKADEVGADVTSPAPGRRADIIISTGPVEIKRVFHRVTEVAPK